MRETEVKYRLAGPGDHDRLRDRLRALGGDWVATGQETNVLFDERTGRLRRADAVLRLRVVDGGPGGTLAFKGPAARDGGLKSRRKVEVGVSDAGRARTLLRALGYRGTLAYAKRRETWRLAGVEVALDRLAVGWFCELEGPAEAVGPLAAQLELEPSSVETATYPELVGRLSGRRPSPGPRR